jgi:hypothetical protein
MSFKYCCLFPACAVALVLSICAVSQQAQNAPPKEVAGISVNYDEALVGNYTLPDPLVLANVSRCVTPRRGLTKDELRS